jgi:hypothetical protein
MTGNELAAEVAARLGIHASRVSVSASVRHTPGSREHDIPPRFYTNWLVTIDGQDDFLGEVTSHDRS